MTGKYERDSPSTKPGQAHNVWLRIIIAIRRTARPYDEATFLKARSRHAPAAVAIVCG